VELVGFSPSELGERLVLWLDSSFGFVHPNGGPIVTWVDRSVYGNDALGTSKPPRLGPAQGSNLLGVVDFDGQSFLSIPDAATLHWGTDDFLIEVVARYQEDQGGEATLYDKTSPEHAVVAGVVMSSVAAADPDAGVLSPGIQVSFRGGGAIDQVLGDSPGVSRGKFHLFGAHRSNIHSLEVRLDGASDRIDPNVQATDVSAVGQPILIGGIPLSSGTTVNSLIGSIAEVIAVHGPVTDTEVARVEGYLLGKYGL
jgi:hypothetical protein